MLSQFVARIFVHVFIICVYQNTQASRFGSPPEWALQILRYPPGDPPAIPEAEKGFDIDKEEMVKFHVWIKGIIPYYIDDLSFDKVLKDTIRIYLYNVNKVAGLHFTELARPPDNDTSRWVFFINRKGQLRCVDHPFNEFTNEGVQRVILGYDCLAAGKLGGVILSLIGIPPQHNAPDRDSYIKVIGKNILPDKLYLFDKLKDNDWLFHDLPYDYFSVSHYGPHQYSSNGDETIVKSELKEEARQINEDSGIGFTETDIKKIHMLYNYIKENQKNPIELGCGELFKPGVNSVPSRKPFLSKPRPKPNRYLLLPEDKEKQESIDDIKNDNDSQESKEVTVNSTDTNEINEDNIQVDLSQIPRDKNIQLLSHKLSKQQILNESDYGTSDEVHKKTV